jgi:hypothetical protein
MSNFEERFDPHRLSDPHPSAAPQPGEIVMEWREADDGLSDEDVLAACGRRGWGVVRPPARGRWRYVGAPHGECGGFIRAEDDTGG